LIFIILKTDHGAMMKEKLSGVFVPTITPFINDEVQYDKLRQNLTKLNSTRIKGHLALGSNGEYKSLSFNEQLKVLEVFVENKGDKVIMAGTGCESTKDTIILSKEAKKIGADFVSVLTPSYFAKQMNDEILIGYYTEVAESIELPLLIYNAPGFAGGVKISPRAIAKLADHPNIVGMKDSSSDGIMGFLAATESIEDFSIIAGSVNFFFTGLVCGATGGILSLANAFPQICCDLYELFLDGDIKKALKLHFKLFNLNSRVSGSGGVSAVKAAVSLAGLFGGQPRRPLKPLAPEKIKQMEDFLREEGLI
jgi:4-hydroxy-2-oxoglutarate aldolase